MVSIEEIKNNERLMKFKSLVLEANKVMNLTAITEDNEFIEKHLYDSLTILDYFDYTNKTIMDLGSGAGFPGIPLAIYLPKANFILLEPTKKRADFLVNVVKELGLKNVKVVNERAELLKKEVRNTLDFVVVRAVSHLAILCELSIPYLKVGGKLIAYKGVNVNEELNETKNALKVLKSSIILNKKEILPVSNGIRYNIVIEKNGETDKKYPRAYNKIKGATL